MIPVTPPDVNKAKKPTAKQKVVLQEILPPKIVANQLNIFIPVGIPIIIVLAVK